MKTDNAGTRINEHADQRINGLYHQVHVNRGRNTEIPEGLTNHRPDRQIRHVMVIHYVKVHPVGAVL